MTGARSEGGTPIVLSCERLDARLVAYLSRAWVVIVTGEANGSYKIELHIIPHQQ